MVYERMVRFWDGLYICLFMRFEGTTSVMIKATLDNSMYLEGQIVTEEYINIKLIQETVHGPLVKWFDNCVHWTPFAFFEYRKRLVVQTLWLCFGSLKTQYSKNYRYIWSVISLCMWAPQWHISLFHFVKIWLSFICLTSKASSQFFYCICFSWKAS